MTQYLKEQEQKRRAQKQKKQENAYFEQKEAAMMKSITQIECRLLRHCKNKEKRCMFCKHNKHHTNRVLPQDYYEPKIPGLKILP